MSELVLYLGNKNLSSWSLRAWLAVVRSGLPFREEVILLDRPDTLQRIRSVSPSGRVPVLRRGELTVFESLAIGEYVAELVPEARLWPADPHARAVARSVSCEMHSGFATMRRELPMDLVARKPMRDMAPGARADIDRVLTLWRECRYRYGDAGQFLFGHFTLADAMFAPVATRFVTYDVPLDPVARAYVDAIYALPEMQRWIADAEREVAAGAG